MCGGKHSHDTWAWRDAVGTTYWDEGTVYALWPDGTALGKSVQFPGRYANVHAPWVLADWGRREEWREEPTCCEFPLPAFIRCSTLLILEVTFHLLLFILWPQTWQLSRLEFPDTWGGYFAHQQYTSSCHSWPVCCQPEHWLGQHSWPLPCRAPVALNVSLCCREIRGRWAAQKVKVRDHLCRYFFPPL